MPSCSASLPAFKKTFGVINLSVILFPAKASLTFARDKTDLPKSMSVSKNPVAPSNKAFILNDSLALSVASISASFAVKLVPHSPFS